MLQDIFPQKLDNHYYNAVLRNTDYVLNFKENTVLLKKSTGRLVLPQYSELQEQLRKSDLQYLFKIDSAQYFLAAANVSDTPLGYEYVPIRALRMLSDDYSDGVCLSVLTAWHLHRWYQNNQFCGRCGTRLAHDDKERKLNCPKCKREIFPTIAPAVIVGVTDGDKLLLSKYASRPYTSYALIAGFTEIGETAEETAAREVMEETGLQVKNIRYYKSQPWGQDGSALFGYFCELDGDATIHIDQNELSMAKWYSRDEIPVEDNGYSLTYEMIGLFKDHPEYFSKSE